MPDRRSSVAVIDLGLEASAELAALRSIGHQTLIEWSVQRLSQTSLLDSIVITGSHELSDVMATLSLHPARWQPSALKTPLSRCIEVAKASQANWIVLVQNNCPFVDPILVDRLVAAAWATPTCDMISFIRASRPQDSLRSLGLVAEVCRRRALRRLAGRVESDDDREVTQLIRSMPELFHARYLPLPAALDRDDIHWALETEDDWGKAHMLLDGSSRGIDERELANMAIHCNTDRLRFEHRAR